MAGFISQRVEEARARRNEAAARLGTTQPKPELPKQPEPQMNPIPRPTNRMEVQGPARRVEVPSMRMGNRQSPIERYEDGSASFRKTPSSSYEKESVYTGTPSIQSSNNESSTLRMGEYAPPPPVLQWRKDDDSGYPPLPIRMPETTPVSSLKNRTAMQHQYSPDAAADLFRIPTFVRYGSFETDLPNESNRWRGVGSEGIAGQYFSDDWADDDFPAQITITGQNLGLPPQQRIDENVGILAHEYAHRWYDKLDRGIINQWQVTGDEEIPSYASERLAPRLSGVHRIDPYNELYAHNVERGPGYVDKDIRDRYYPGLYQDDIRPPNPPTLGSEHYRLQEDEAYRYKPGVEPYLPPPSYLVGIPQGGGYSVENWVDENMPPYAHGYYEDGGIAYDAMPYPTQWQDPLWPSMRMYESYDSAIRG